MSNNTYDDEFDGIGGSYIVDPKTGKRKPAPAETAPVEPVTPTTESKDNGIKE
jgi:hypothetical protein